MKKKVLHVSAGGLNPGGVGTVIFSIVETLRDDFEFSCVVFNTRSPEEKKFQKYGNLFRINCYPKKGKRDYFELVTRPFKLYFGIKKICKKNKFDVIHCHNQRDQWICLLAAKHANVPVRIAHSHVANISKKLSFIERKYKSISPNMLRKVATKKIGCSEIACKQLYGDNDFVVIPNSIDLENFSVNKRKEHKGINFIHVGRFNYAKNQEFVIETFSEIAKHTENVHLYLVGYGEKRATDSIMEQIRQCGIESFVEVIPGNKIDVTDYYAISDYMIFPSRFEGFGIALIEAQAMGIYCYASDVIPTDTDLGLANYLKLSDGPKVWSEYILHDLEENKQKCDMNKLSRYSNRQVAAMYSNLYHDN